MSYNYGSSSGEKRPIKVFVDTTGCAVNIAYSEYLCGLLEAKGFVLTNSLDDADVIVLHYCAIKKPTEDRSLSYLKKLIERVRGNQKIVVAGCLAQGVRLRIKERFPQVNLVGVYHVLDLPEIIPKIIEGERVEIVSVRDFVPHGLPRKLLNRFIGVVPISRGCLGECTFCIDRLIWGRLRSYPLDKIIKEVKRLISMGVKEIRLSGQDTGPYGWDIGLTLADLLQEISALEGDFMVRLGMASPDTFAKVVDDVLDIMCSDRRFYRYLHLPVQSGSNRILKLMRRKYTREEFLELIRDIRKKLPDVTIATDIIVAFPTETEEDHKETLSLLIELRPDIVNISRYGDRPGVPAAKLYPKVHSEVAKRRTKEVAKIVMKISLERNLEYVGKTVDVLLLEQSDDRLLGRTRNYKIAALQAPQDLLGKWVRVNISEATWKTLYGNLISA